MPVPCVSYLIFVLLDQLPDNIQLGIKANGEVYWNGEPVAPSRTVAGRPAPGRVNDENAFLLGGVAGHAGLFSTGADLARFAQVWLRGGSSPSGAWVKSATLKEFLRRSPQSGTRALGWDTPDHAGVHPSVYGALADGETYGHTGWTGTMLWIDPDHDLFLVFLTNRSYDPRSRRFDAVIEYVDEWAEARKDLDYEMLLHNVRVAAAIV